MDCAETLGGWVRCDNIGTVEKDGPYWGPLICVLSNADMTKVEGGLRAALML